MNYSQAVQFIENSFTSFQTAGRAAYKEGLEAITAMCKALDNPQRDYYTIHIAGTNGKGSVAHMLASVLQAAGYRTGLYTSPHMRDFRERIRVDGEMIPEKAVARFISDHGAKMTELGLSYFDMTTAMAFSHFSESDVEIAVIETGLGGRLDSTNIIRPELSIITNAALDHTEILGDTAAKIAYEKAGIIKRGVPVVVGESNSESDPVFEQQAASCDSKLIFADRFFKCIDRQRSGNLERYTLQRVSDGRVQEIDLDLLGSCQEKNIVTLRTAVHVLRHETHVNISTRALLTGCRTVVESTGLLGRWQKLAEGPLTIADAGHNSHAIRYVAEQLAAAEYGRLYMVIGFASDKDFPEILPLLPRDAHYIFTQAASQRALPAGDLAHMASEFGLKGETVDNVAAALTRAREMAAPEDMIFIGGSNFVVAEIV